MIAEVEQKIDYIQFIVIDLFAGMGGVTLGFEDARASWEEMRAFLKSVGITPPRTRESFFKVAKVVAAVNHDHLAIKSHWSNHMDVEHFEEDIRLLDPFGRLKRLVDLYAAMYPEAKIILWASLECTNFSKAKGGASRDQDSRTLAHDLYRYILALNPDYVMIENVVEFMAWGPMIPKVSQTSEGYKFCPLKYHGERGGKKAKKKKKKGPSNLSIGPCLIPESSKNGTDWLAWREHIRGFGYEDSWKQINSADLGSLTSRNRLFGCFAKKGLPIVWPAATHSKKPEKTTLAQPLQKWKAVKVALDFEDEGRGIFNRFKRKPKVLKNKKGYLYCKLAEYDLKYKTFGPIPNVLSTKTFQRLFMGSVKHIGGGKEQYNERIKTQPLAEQFIHKAYSGDPEHKSSSIEDPLSTVTVRDHNQLIKAVFINQRNGENMESKSTSIEQPARVITTSGGNLEIVSAFITKWNGNDRGDGNKGHSVEQPSPVVTAQNRLGLATAEFLQIYNSNKASVGGNEGRSVEGPAPTIGTRNLPTKVRAEFLVNHNHSSHSNSVSEPAPTITGSDKLGKAHFLQLYYSGDSHDSSIENPSPTLLTKDRIAKVQATFISKYNGVNGGKHDNCDSIEDPSSAITGGDRHAKVTATFIDQQFSQGKQNQSVEDPLGAVTTVPKSKIVQAHFIDKQYRGDSNHQSIEQPAGAIMPNDKHSLIEVESMSSLDPSVYVVVARQDKAPLYLLTCLNGHVAVPVYDTDCEWAIKLKGFMALYDICDIKMRMLKVVEIKRIQGFPENYILLGDQTEQKKFLGNAVNPIVVTMMTEAYKHKFIEPFMKVAKTKQKQIRRAA